MTTVKESIKIMMEIQQKKNFFNFQKSLMRISSSSEAGFTLIELSIALLVIGLILSGLMMKGAGLLESARLNKVLSQVEEIKTAVSRFQEQFNALPGDYSEAKANIHDSLIDGNQNGTIEGDGLDPASEAGQFWVHLSARNLISDVGSPRTTQSAEGDGSQTHMNFGNGAPSAKIGGGFTVQNNPTSDMPGLWLVLGAKNGSLGNGALLTPLQAMQLDQKADNGHPTTGNVRAISGSEKKCLTEQKTYNTKLDEPACVLYFKL